MQRLQYLFAIFWLLLLFLIPSNTSFSAPLPKATQKLLKKLNLDPSLLADLDKELQVPNEWIEQAKKNGKLRIRSTPARPGELKTLFGPFKERYPYIEIDFSGTNQQTRSVKTLIAYKRGRVLADFMTSIGGFLHEFKAADALVDLCDIPIAINVSEKAKDPNGGWIGINATASSEPSFFLSGFRSSVKKKSLEIVNMK